MIFNIICKIEIAIRKALKNFRLAMVIVFAITSVWFLLAFMVWQNQMTKANSTVPASIDVMDYGVVYETESKSDWIVSVPKTGDIEYRNKAIIHSKYFCTCYLSSASNDILASVTCDYNSGNIIISPLLKDGKAIDHDTNISMLRFQIDCAYNKKHQVRVIRAVTK